MILVLESNQLLPSVRVEGIEPSSHAWQARIHPLNYTRELVPPLGIAPSPSRLQRDASTWLA